MRPLADCNCAVCSCVHASSAAFVAFRGEMSGAARRQNIKMKMLLAENMAPPEGLFSPRGARRLPDHETAGDPFKRANRMENRGLAGTFAPPPARPVGRSNWKLFPVNRPFYRSSSGT